MKKYYNVELLRFLFACLIVNFHITNTNIMKFVGDSPAYLAMKEATFLSKNIVESFLVIGGFFLYESYRRNKEKPFMDFAMDKVARLWPVYAFYILVMVVFFNMALQDAIFDLVFLRATAISMGYTGILWYIGPFFYCNLLIFALLKYTSKPISMLTLSLTAFLCYSINLNANNGILGKGMVFTFLSEGMLRVLGGMCIGVLLAATVEEYKRNYGCAAGTEKKLWQFVATITEAVVLPLMIYLFICGGHRIKNVFLMVLLFIVLFVCFISGNGFISNALNRPVFGLLGRYAYSIYVMQQVSFNILKKTFWKNTAFISENVYPTVAVSIAFCVFVGVVTYHLVEQPAVILYKKWKNNRKENLNN